MCSARSGSPGKDSAKSPASPLPGMEERTIRAGDSAPGQWSADRHSSDAALRRDRSKGRPATLHVRAGRGPGARACCRGLRHARSVLARRNLSPAIPQVCRNLCKFAQVSGCLRRYRDRRGYGTRGEGNGLAGACPGRDRPRNPSRAGQRRPLRSLNWTVLLRLGIGDTSVHAGDAALVDKRMASEEQGMNSIAALINALSAGRKR